MFQLMAIEKLQVFEKRKCIHNHIVVSFQNINRLWTIVRYPFQCHHPFIRQISVGIEKVFLNNVVIQVILVFDRLHDLVVGRLSEHEDEANVGKEISRSPGFSNENATLIVGRSRVNVDNDVDIVLTNGRTRIQDVVEIVGIDNVILWCIGIGRN